MDTNVTTGNLDNYMRFSYVHKGDRVQVQFQNTGDVEDIFLEFENFLRAAGIDIQGRIGWLPYAEGAYNAKSKVETTTASQ